MRPDQRADERQRQETRAAMHAQIDRVCDAWAEVATQAKEMGRGYPSGGEGSGETGSLTERVALSEAFDPATAASDWLNHLEETRAHLKNLDGKLKRILPSKCVRKPGEPAHRRGCECAVNASERGRQNTVDLCTWCNDPAPRVKRLDGQPYCHPDLDKTCWRSAYDLKRRSA